MQNGSSVGDNFDVPVTDYTNLQMDFDIDWSWHPVYQFPLAACHASFPLCPSLSLSKQ